MAASLLRVISSGVQDTRLLCSKGEPDVSLFTKAFIRAGRFTTQWVRLDFDNTPNLGTTATITLPRKGHLISRLYLVTTMPDIYTEQNRARLAAGENFVGPSFGWTNSLGHALIQDANLEIGGATVERLDGRLLEVLDEFYSPLEKQISMNKLICRKDNGFTHRSFGYNELNTRVVTPLPFWFSAGDSALALPIDAIQADQVKLNIRFNPINALYVSDSYAQISETTNPVAGEAYFSLPNAVFYQTDASGSIVSGLPTNSLVSEIPDVRTPNRFSLGETYILAEYIYLDKPEANKFRLSDINVPITQHYIFDPVDSQNMNQIRYKFSVPNPTRNLFFFLNRYEATRYNAPFLASRDLSGFSYSSNSYTPTRTPWWPDASGLNTQFLGTVRSGFSTRDSEPLKSIQLTYEGKLVRYNTDTPSLFRSILPSYEMRKSPWVNRYIYTLMFGVQHGLIAPSFPSGQANLDKLQNIELSLQLHPNTGTLNTNSVPRYNMYLYAETYNILRVYAGRAGLLFAY